jgi:hypothetical protein
MIRTSEIYKLPVRCRACGSQQYSTLLRIFQARPLICVACEQKIDLPHDNRMTFNRAVKFVESEQEWISSKHVTANGRTSAGEEMASGSEPFRPRRTLGKFPAQSSRSHIDTTPRAFTWITPAVLALSGSLVFIWVVFLSTLLVQLL